MSVAKDIKIIDSRELRDISVWLWQGGGRWPADHGPLPVEDRPGRNRVRPGRPGSPGGNGSKGTKGNE